MVSGWRLRVATGVVAASCLVVCLSGVAAAKGASDVTITGPGLTAPLRFACCRETPADNGGTSFLVGNPNDVADATGMFYAAFRTHPTPMVRERPVGPLGPRYRVTFNFSTGVDEVTPIRQDVYPFARAGLVARTPPDQHLFDKEVRSGWYVSAAQPNGGGMTTDDARNLLASLGITREVAGLAAR
ncbi:MAG TPA: hypothetical protein VFZ17_11945 [Acidimicrobiia bacterium]|nr:hypothetical protein [Acidimicrobiia bacterium]